MGRPTYSGQTTRTKDTLLPRNWSLLYACTWHVNTSRFSRTQPQSILGMAITKDHVKLYPANVEYMVSC
jgi:hypothetical protein